MSMVPQIAVPGWKEWSPNARWREWIPLVTQQQRLRSVNQVLAYNVPWHPGSSMYFTLHQTLMSSPFYTSEVVQHQHPRWGEIDLSSLSSTVNTSATGVVLRLWLHQGSGNQDDVVLVWAVYFSGLVYLGPHLVGKTSYFNKNAVVLHMQGGYFTDSQCLKELPQGAMIRKLSIALPLSETRPSYSISLLLRLRNTQLAIKKLTQQSVILRDKILAGSISSEEASISQEKNPTIRKLLSKGRPKPQDKQEKLAVSRQVEMLRFRVQLLRQEKQQKLEQLECLKKQKDIAVNNNADRSCELTERYQNLHKEIEHFRNRMQTFPEMREHFLIKSSELSYRKKHLMSQLVNIYPVTLADGKYTICGIHLPNSDELSSTDDVSVSVALGYVAHLVQMASTFLQVPLRFPVIHFGSRSKIVDHISDKIPDREREFPLYSRGKDKIKLCYGVYLLNRNIAQLRWQMGFPTNELRATLHNVYHLLHHNQFSVLESHHRSMSGSSLDVFPSSVNASPVGSFMGAGSSYSTTISPDFCRGRNRNSKSMGSTELLFPSRKTANGSYASPPLSQNDGIDGFASSSVLSCSLDKGLDEFEELKIMKRSDDSISIRSNPHSNHVPLSSNLASVGSEPNLVIHCNVSSVNGDVATGMHLEPNNHADLEPNNHAERGRLASHTSSDDDESSTFANAHKLSNKSEFTLVTESLAKLVDSSKSFEVDKSLSVIEDHSTSDTFLTLQPDTSELPQSESDKEDDNFESSIKEQVEEVCNDILPKPLSSRNSSERDVYSFIQGRENMEVDIGTDALAALSNNKHSNPSDFKSSLDMVVDKSSNTDAGRGRLCDTNQETEQYQWECIGVEESVLVDNLFASVTSRTEALATHSTSFNLMSSRHGST